MNSETALLLGLALGFSLTIPPGPMNALIATRSVRSLRRGVLTGLGAMSADLVLGILVYGFRAEIPLGSIVRWVYLVGAGVMVYLGVRVIQRQQEPPAIREETSDARTYTQAVLVGVSNPFQIIWWLTAGLAVAYLGGLVLFVGLFGAIAVWVFSFSAAIYLGTRRRPNIARAVVYASIAIMFALAAYFVALAVG